MNLAEQYLANRLARRAHAGNLRHLPSGREGIDLCSNDYLGLATAGTLQVAGAAGSTGSRLLTGNSTMAEELEADIARFHQAEAALLFTSGYAANTGLLSAVASRDTTILYDELCHASILDGIRLSLCGSKRKFAHNNIGDLQRQLERCSPGPVIVVTESIFSMDGDAAPLKEIAEVCGTAGAALVVDEAHATGIYGDHGEGLVQQLGLSEQIFARVHTFGKALGCHGAVVVGSRLLKDYLVNFARPFIYATALPPHSLSAIRSAYKVLRDGRIDARPLHELIAYFRQQVAESGISGWKESLSPVQALVVGGNERTRQLAEKLFAGGYIIHPILSPTVPEGSERLRICLHIYNTKEQVDGLFSILKDELC